ncbi:MAG TPA: DUF222 domain-containing protein, partial [Ilumatobacteraceae bacterium]|nr:DUF222 domain-containing protein [Ilumatobacteraceae bacterium]
MNGDVATLDPLDAVGMLDCVADLLEAWDLDRLVPSEMHEQVIGLTRGIDRVKAAMAGLLQRWDASGVWGMDGSKSAAARLSRQTGSSKRTAASQLSLARGLARQPKLGAAWLAGTVSEDVVRLLNAANAGGREALFERDQEMLIANCAGQRYADAVRVVRYWEIRANAQVNPDGDQPVERSARLAETLDGAMSLTAHLDPVGGAEVQEALRRIERDLYRDDQRTGNKRSLDERMADAVVEMARRAMAAPAGARRPSPLVTIIVGDASMRHLLELSNGQIVRPVDVVDHLDDSMVQSFIYDGITPLAASSQRTFKGRLRRAIQVRDRRCQHPSGCDEPMHRCDVDHTIPHTDGGLTDPLNGRLQC